MTQPEDKRASELRAVSYWLRQLDTYTEAHMLALRFIYFAREVASSDWYPADWYPDRVRVSVFPPPPAVRRKRGRPPRGDQTLNVDQAIKMAHAQDLNLAIAGAVVLLHECTGLDRITNRSPSGAVRTTACSIVAQVLRERFFISKTPEAVAKISERHRAVALPMVQLWERYEKIPWEKRPPVWRLGELLLPQPTDKK
jgi:hypothetical protein